MKIAVAGGTGFIGTALVKALAERGHAVTVLTRRPRALSPPAATVVLDPDRPAGLEKILEDYDGVVNLAGESIAAGRWTKRRKSAILESRLKATRALVDIMAKCRKGPEVFLSASAVGYYGNRGGESLTEDADSGGGFLAEVCRKWEEEAKRAETAARRVVTPRIGIVLGRGGGALAKMLLPFKLGLGGPLGDGRQWMSWVHAEDLAGLMLHALENRACRGPLNAVAPHPVTNRDFSKTLGKVLWRPAFFPVPAFVLRLILGEMAGEMLLSGQKVSSARAQGLGYKFKHPRLKDALQTLV
jgi:uncharacterized protein